MNFIALLILIVLAAISLLTGAGDLSLGSLLAGDQAALLLMWESRVPRAIAIILAGAGLSVAGLIMQQLTRNRFVSPTTAATMDSARLGVLVAMLFFGNTGQITKMLVAFVFAMGGTFLFLGILRRVRVANAIMIPLIGIMTGNIIDSITTFIAYRTDLIQNVNSWLHGSFSMVMKGRYELLFLLLPAVLLTYFFARAFTIAGMGEDIAKNLGLHYNLVLNIGLVLAALISSLVLVTVGSIPFLGLIVPNLVTMIFGDNTSKNLTMTALAGSMVLLAADIISRLIIAPYEISVSVTAGVLGSLVFLMILLGGRHR